MYKYCIVPKCTNTSIKTPEKLFFNVPKDPKLRKKWCSVVKRDDKTPLSAQATRHCCEDHFDVEADMDNYIRYKLIGGQLKLKKGILPHKFECQKPKSIIVRPGFCEDSGHENLFLHTIEEEECDTLDLDSDRPCSLPSLEDIKKCDECEVEIEIEMDECELYRCVQCPIVVMCAKCGRDNAHAHHCVLRIPSLLVYDKIHCLFNEMMEVFNKKLSEKNKGFLTLGVHDEETTHQENIPADSETSKENKSTSISHVNDNCLKQPINEPMVCLPEVKVEPEPDPLTLTTPGDPLVSSLGHEPNKRRRKYNTKRKCLSTKVTQKKMRLEEIHVQYHEDEDVKVKEEPLDSGE